MKIAVLIVRSLMGLLFLFASITYFFKLINPPAPTGAMKTFSDGLQAAVYLMPVVKVIELSCGVAFLSGRFVPLAAVLIAPIIVNILLVNAFLGHEGLPLALFLVAGNAFLAYHHRSSYAPLFRSR